MSKNREELSYIKKDFEELTSKLKELTDEELSEITGGETLVRNNYAKYTASDGSVIVIFFNTIPYTIYTFANNEEAATAGY